MELEVLKQKALNTVEKDMGYYKEAVEGIDTWTKKECSCAHVLSRFCDRCAYIHHFKSIIDGIQNKYWHG